MIFSKFMKVWVVFYVALAYKFAMEYTSYIPWETPQHLSIMLNVVLGICGVWMGAMIMSRLGDDMMGEKDSFSLFGNKKLWRVWQWAVAPMLIYSLYKFDHGGIIALSFTFYFGMKCLITNQNKHVEVADKRELLSRARQETAEKVTL